MSIIIKNTLLDNRKKDIYIEDNRIAEINDNISSEADYRVDGKSKAVIPGLFNCHTHSAMTLMRGYADDMELDEWLNKKIWPLEAKLTDKDVYWGTRLACLEMVKTGTVFFNDMYWHPRSTSKAAHDSGMRAAISSVMIDMFDESKADEQKKETRRLFEEAGRYGKRVSFALGPHAMYTVSPESLLWVKEYAQKNRLRIHFHMSETKKEVDDCLRMHHMRPVEYLDSIGFLCPELVACHAVWVDDKEIGLLKKSNVTVVHNPASNMKLSVGEAFPYNAMKKAGLNMCLGTDGCASNNSLDMFSEMKAAALLQKFRTNDPTAMPAGDAFNMATRNSAKAFGIESGEIAVGKLADLLLIDLKKHSMVPNHNFISNLVYSANGSCVDTVICDGSILMNGRVVKDEEMILEKAARHAERLCQP